MVAAVQYSNIILEYTAAVLHSDSQRVKFCLSAFPQTFAAPPLRGCSDTLVRDKLQRFSKNVCSLSPQGHGGNKQRKCYENVTKVFVAELSKTLVHPNVLLSSATPWGGQATKTFVAVL